MKTKIVLLSLVACMHMQTQAQMTWSDISPPGMSAYKITDVYANGSTVICVGDNPNPGPNVFTAVSISTDSGQTWQTQTSNFSNFFAQTIVFTDSVTGFIGGYSYLGGQFQSATKKTTDGGQTWGPLVTYTLQGFKTIRYKDILNGYACGFNTFLSTGAFFKTSDGGVTWTAIYTNTTEGFYDVWMAPDDLNGYAIDEWTGVYKTADGGITWTKYLNTTGLIMGMHFWDKDNGMICQLNGKIYRTNNAGASWTIVNTGGNTKPLGDIEFLDNNIGLCVGDNGTVLETMNGGITWTSTTVPGGATLMDVRFYGTAAYAFGEDGKLYAGAMPTPTFTSLYEQRLNGTIAIYPNPARDRVTLSTKGVNAVSAGVYNSLGELVLSQKIEAGQNSIDVSSLPPAFYSIITTDGGGRSYMSKVIKE